VRGVAPQATPPAQQREVWPARHTLLWGCKGAGIFVHEGLAVRLWRLACVHAVPRHLPRADHPLCSVGVLLVLRVVFRGCRTCATCLHPWPWTKASTKWLRASCYGRTPCKHPRPRYPQPLPCPAPPPSCLCTPALSLPARSLPNPLPMLFALPSALFSPVCALWCTAMSNSRQGGEHFASWGTGMSLDRGLGSQGAGLGGGVGGMAWRRRTPSLASTWPRVRPWCPLRQRPRVLVQKQPQLPQLPPLPLVLPLLQLLAAWRAGEAQARLFRHKSQCTSDCDQAAAPALLRCTLGGFGWKLMPKGRETLASLGVSVCVCVWSAQPYAALEQRSRQCLLLRPHPHPPAAPAPPLHAAWSGSRIACRYARVWL